MTARKPVIEEDLVGNYLRIRRRNRRVFFAIFAVAIIVAVVLILF